MIRFLSAAVTMFTAFALSLTSAHAVEDTWDYSVQVSSAVQASPAKITLSWPQDTNGTPSSYTVYRKAPTDSSWGSGTALPGSTTTYTDTNVATGIAYEYQIVKNAGSYNGYGYVETGINVPLTDSRGKVILLVDNTMSAPLATELATLQQDLAGDGWTVLRHDVSRTDSVSSVKALIKADYAADPAHVKSVFLFGHIPVPYSGQLNPDGHPDHIGAWPADVYYGDVDDDWTDNTVNYVQTVNTDPADAARITNVPGDGKFDQTDIPSAVELQVGRVDLANMPGRIYWGGPSSFPSETELLRKYLNKDHAFRTRAVNPPRRAILGDYFGVRGGEAFAASGFRSFAPLVGASNIRNLNTEFNDQKGVWIPQSAQNDYLLAYACGAGSYTAITGIGNTGIYNEGTTTEMVTNNVHGVFNLIFGSWLGDWDHEDDMLRAPLATDYGLVSVWSGRPHWFIHPMGLGETIGSVTQLNQNNVNTYQTTINTAAHRIHIALMGDPTLRLHPVVPVTSVTGAVSGSNVALSWGASSDSNVVGYHVYRASSANGPYTRLTSSPITATNYTDSGAPAGATYMVRTVKLESTPSGSYYNASQGAFWSATTGSTGGVTSTSSSTATASSTSGVTSPTGATTTPSTSTVSTTSTTVSPSSSTSSATVSTAAVSTSAISAVTAPVSANLGGDVWFDDTLPAGATGSGSNGDGWNWVTSSPTPFSGTNAHQTSLGNGIHAHMFDWASSPFVISTGETLYTYVYIDPANPPTEIMLSWAKDSSDWNHRAYWGSNDIAYGTDGTASQYRVGDLPAAGQWVRLEVPAKAVGLEGTSVYGMSFILNNGRATFDATGKSLPTAPSFAVLPSVTVTSSDTYANITDASDTAQVVFTRSGSTANPLTVNFTLGGTAGKWDDYYRAPEGDMPTSVTIPAGATSTTMTIVGRANTTNASPETAIFALASDPSYATGSQNTTTLTFGTTSAPTVSDSSSASTTQSTGSTSGSDSVWFDDSLPKGASGYGTNGDGWNWITQNPSAYSGAKSHQTVLANGAHEHAFNWASTPLSVGSGDKLFTYVYIDPANPPTEIMLSWSKGVSDWNHRAYWGANNLAYGVNNTASQYYMGALPATGQWVRLEVPASAVGLEGTNVAGMSFILYGGRATFDKAGKSTGSSTGTSGGTTSGGTTSGTSSSSGSTTSTSSGGTSTSSTSTSGGTTSGGTTSGGTSSGSSSTTTTSTSSGGTTTPSTGGDTMWFDDALPAGAGGVSNGGDSWNWVSSTPSPYTGGKAHQSALASGIHEHLFGWASTPFTIATGDKLYTYVYLDPANPPSEVMLSWYSNSWEHRAYWGANQIAYGTDGTVSQYHVGALPASGGWVRLEVPASAVGLEGNSLTGMGFTLYGGRATFDDSGKSNGTSTSGGTTSGGTTSGTSSSSGSTTSTSGGTTSGGTTSGSGSTSSGSTSSGGSTSGGSTSSGPLSSTLENSILREPQVGDTRLRVITPTLIELDRVTTKDQSASTVTDWNFVDSNGNFSAPSTSAFNVTVNGQTVGISSIGFQRRVGYAKLRIYDLRINNALFLTLSSPIADGQSVAVTNPDGSLWPSSMTFATTADTLRYSPAIHVNQEGYVPSFPKKAMIGYLAGNLGEVSVDSSAGFKLVDATTGATVFTGSLTTRADQGWAYSPAPYQKVLQADFSSFTTPGRYRLVVPGMGASLPFLIDNGIAMNFTRTYELGMYEQRSGMATTLPYTRFAHAADHMAAAEIPTSDAAYNFTWSCIASKSAGNSDQTAPQLTSPSSQLYPFINQGTVDVSGGHFDAGDYSKYTIDVALLVHQLMFTVDSIPGAAALDNLGIAESGDGISDIMQEAKWEADYLAKLQDADGGFYFIVYPKNREYEWDVLPENGDQQVVWPKNTSATAAAVAALAQCASSPAFKQAYPDVAASYLNKAKLGWQFLMNAQAKYGKVGAYQKVTFYGDQFDDNDELAWAACQMYLATGEAQYQQKLFEWYPNPTDTNTVLWGWWHLYQSYGCAIRSYAFAARSGRLAASQLDATYLARCESEIKAAGQAALNWSNMSAYGTAFPDNTKRIMAAGWYFSLDQASDMAVAYQIDPQPAYLDAVVTNMNYEAGTNPANQAYLAGIGVKRQQNMVSQFGYNSRRLLPPDGEPSGNIQGSFSYIDTYGNSLGNLSFPLDGSTSNAFPFYDRFTDIWNVTTEFVTVNQSRALTAAAFLATQTPATSTSWKPSVTANIVVPTSASVGQSVTLSLGALAVDLTNARIIWEARDQQPSYGATYTFTPQNSGAQWVEVEISWPDGRRVFGTASFNAQ